MADATAEVHRDLLHPRLIFEHEFGKAGFRIASVSAPDEDGYHLITFTSPDLPDDCRGHQEIYLDDDKVKFKPWTDHG